MTTISNFETLYAAIRVPGDIKAEHSLGSHSASAVAVFLLNDLLVQPCLVPEVAVQASLVANRLGIDDSDLMVFIYASPFLQAECRRSDTGGCVVRMSSALVASLTSDELNFVMGHEIAHFLLGHVFEGVRSEDMSLEDALISRRRELTADRLGYLACRSLPSALSAMIKTVSGLTSSHLRIDVAAFISQLRSVDIRENSASNAMNTHPAFLIRCRALLWFSMSVPNDMTGLVPDTKGIDVANTRVVNDLERFVEGPVASLISAAIDDASFWRECRIIVEKRVFAKPDQIVFAEKFGSERTDKFKQLLSLLSPEEAQLECYQRCEDSLAHLRKVAPRAYAAIFDIS